MIKRYYYINKKNIYFLKFLLEACEGIATFETINAKKGIILLYIACGALNEFDMLINELKKDFTIYELL
ncbi:MAG: DUF4911 domain-containing protein [Deltaproteobacteria bacterium]|nr:DUF4911 domain-containing protein [Deltaproteobacteria bacterium]